MLTGVKSECVEGATTKDKIDLVSNMTAEAYISLVKSHGFVNISCPGTLTMVPSGYIVMNFLTSEEGCNGLRWSFSASASSSTAKKNIADMLSAWPSMAQDSTWSKLTAVLDG